MEVDIDGTGGDVGEQFGHAGYVAVFDDFRTATDRSGGTDGWLRRLLITDPPQNSDRSFKH